MKKLCLDCRTPISSRATRCRLCAQRRRRKGHKRLKIFCIECRQQAFHHAKGLCKRCYHRLQMRRLWATNLSYKKYQQRYRQEHLKEHAAQMRRWRKKNPEKVAITNRKNYRKNRRVRIAHSIRWAKENPERVAAIRARAKAKRKAREASLPNTLTSDQIEHLFNVGKATYPGEDLHFDHIVPVSRSGGTTLANMHFIPASLNLSKNDKLPEEAYVQGALI